MIQSVSGGLKNTLKRDSSSQSTEMETTVELERRKSKCAFRDETRSVQSVTVCSNSKGDVIVLSHS